MTKRNEKRKRNIMLLYQMQSNGVPNGIGDIPIPFGTQFEWI